MLKLIEMDKFLLIAMSTLKTEGRKDKSALPVTTLMPEWLKQVTPVKSVPPHILQASRTLVPPHSPEQSWKVNVMYILLILETKDIYCIHYCTTVMYSGQQ
jgi:hypothetical protein